MKWDGARERVENEMGERERRTVALEGREVGMEENGRGMEQNGALEGKRVENEMG